MESRRDGQTLFGSTRPRRPASPRRTSRAAQPFGPSRRRSTVGRGQSELVGAVLILGMSLLVISTVVAIGGTQLVDQQADADLRSAETSFTNFASKAVLVAAGESDGRTVTLPRDNRADTAVDPDQGRLLIELRDETGTTVEKKLEDRSLGGITYQHGEDTVAYEGGGVWRMEDGRARMVSPPPIHYRGTTFTMPVPLIESGDASGGAARVSPAGPRERIYPDPTDEDRQNPLSNGTVHITVESDYYEAWGRFFESRTGGSVSYDHDDDSVTLRLATEDPDRQLRDAVTGTSPSRFEIRGAGGSSFTDSYNSSVGPYDDSQSGDGDISTTGTIELGGGAEVFGDVESGGSVDIGGGSTIFGNASYTDSLGLTGNAEVTGWTADNASVTPARPIDSLVDVERSSLADDNDNDDAEIIDESRFVDTTEESGTLILTEGRYSLDELNLDGRTLRIDVSDGDVRLGVNGDLALAGENVEVVGDGGDARLYVSRNVELTSGTAVEVEDDVSPRLWVYGTRDATVEVRSGSTFTGVIYAPTDSSGSGTVDINSATVKGSVVGGRTTLQAGGTVHFDTALAGTDPLHGADVPRVTFLHISGSPITVDRR
ncbi:polymer-forming cytoskeletal protein [Halorubrum vacuolatum]|uniref:DUF7305 domain-containing protein n=1 Tax=Halorubrum vacuolatum TaxID=63740 RepID=A0A238UQG0_HALVU|nr:polymer-forming cytoskeletal protein [Halorubrum vacuolatum]SNR23887.1 hypothetical protein SAMN06264855_101186 [Halorubrum vacuolatum]